MVIIHRARRRPQLPCFQDGDPSQMSHMRGWWVWPLRLLPLWSYCLEQYGDGNLGIVAEGQHWSYGRQKLSKCSSSKAMSLGKCSGEREMIMMEASSCKDILPCRNSRCFMIYLSINMALREALLSFEKHRPLCPSCRSPPPMQLEFISTWTVFALNNSLSCQRV